jgi:predicted RNA-binding protein YlxR (DUF448 family)
MMTATRSLPADGQAEGRRSRHEGKRSCVGCGQRIDVSQARSELIRLVFVPGPDSIAVVPDVTATARGRGAWLHARLTCLEQAAKKGFARSAKAAVRVDPAVLARQIAEQARRRVAGLLSAAVRSRHIAIGARAVAERWRAGEVALILVAQDAAYGATLQEIDAARAAAAVMVFGTKASLGESLGRGEVAVAAIDDEGMAAALRHAVALSETFQARGGDAPEGVAAATSSDRGSVPAGRE